MVFCDSTANTFTVNSITIVSNFNQTFQLVSILSLFHFFIKYSFECLTVNEDITLKIQVELDKVRITNLFNCHFFHNTNF